MPARASTDQLTIRPLSADTWPAFADLVARHNGVFGGCWCTWFHSLSRGKDRTYESNRDLKCRLVEEGRARAALVFDRENSLVPPNGRKPRTPPRRLTRRQGPRRSSVSPRAPEVQSNTATPAVVATAVLRASPPGERLLRGQQVRMEKGPGRAAIQVGASYHRLCDA